MKRIMSFLIIFFFLGCQNTTTPSHNNISKNTQNIDNLYNKAVSNAVSLLQKRSKWYDREEKLPLTIVGVGFIDPKAKRTKEYVYLQKALKLIAKKPSYLNADLQKRYNSISFKDFLSSDEIKKKFYAVYSHRDDEKETLIDILRPQNDHPYQELFVTLDYDDLKKGNLTLHGYKYVKQKDKLPNAYYYTLTKTGYKKLSKKERQKAVFNAIETILSLSIPEYISVDRKKLLNGKKELSFSILLPNGTIQKTKYRYQVNNNLVKTKQELENIKLKSTKAKLVKTFKKFSKGDIEIKSIAISPNGKFALIGTSFAQKDIGTIYYLDLRSGKVIKTLKGQNDIILALAISPDGKYALSASANWDENLWYWNLETGKLIGKLRGHLSNVTSVVFSPDGKYAASGGDDLTARYWDLTNLKELKVYKHAKDSVYVYGFSKDGKKLYTKSLDGIFRIYNLDDDSFYFAHSKGFTVSPNLKYSIAKNKTNLELWDIKGYHSLETITLPYSIATATFSFDNKHIIASTKNKGIYYIDFNTKNSSKISQSSSLITAIYPSPKNDFFLAVERYSKLHFYKFYLSKKYQKELLAKQRQLKAIQQSSSYITNYSKQKILTTQLSLNDIQILAKYDYLQNTQLTNKNIQNISTIFGYTLFDPVLLYSLNSYHNKINIPIDPKQTLIGKGYQLKNLYFSTYLPLQVSGYQLIDKKTILFPKDLFHSNNNEAVKDVALTPNNRYAMIAGYDIYAWDLKTGKLIKKTNSYYKGDFSTSLTALNDQVVLKTTYDGRLYYWNFKTNRRNIYYANCFIFALAPNKKYFISADHYTDSTKTYNFFKSYRMTTKGLNQLNTFKGHKDQIKALAISPDNKYALSGSADKTVRLWDLKTAKLIKIFKGHNDTVTTVAFSPDGKYILSGSADKTLRLWDLKRKRLIKVFKKDAKKIVVAKFTPDGKYILSGGDDNVLRMWDVKTGKNIKNFFGHTDRISSIAIASDGSFAITGSYDNTLRVWYLH